MESEAETEMVNTSKGNTPLMTLTQNQNDVLEALLEGIFETGKINLVPFYCSFAAGRIYQVLNASDGYEAQTDAAHGLFKTVRACHDNHEETREVAKGLYNASLGELMDDSDSLAEDLYMNHQFIIRLHSVLANAMKNMMQQHPTHENAAMWEYVYDNCVAVLEKCAELQVTFETAVA